MASTSPIPPVTEIDLTPFADILNNARTDHEQARTTGVVATSNEGQPDLALKGSLMVWDKDHLAWWERSKRETLAAVATNPRVAVFVRNPTRDRRTLRFYGTARVVDDLELREQVWSRVRQVEKDTDKEKQGVAVIVRVDRDEPNNTNALGTLSAPLTGQGWRVCASGLASAQWGKAELMVTVSEGSGTPGEGFVVRVDPITSDCALKVSTADPSRGFEVMAQAFVGSELGWVAAWRTDARALFHTVDGGRTWTELALPADVAYVAELQFVDERNGWMLGFAGRGFQYGCDQAAPADIPRCRDILFRTRDGGRTWTSLRVMALAPAGSPGLKEIQLVDAMTGWLLERDGPAPCEIGKPCFNLLSTTDGGTQWRTVLARTAMTDLRFVDRTHGWSLVPSEGGVDAIATADGGTTWSRP